VSIVAITPRGVLHHIMIRGIERGDRWVLIRSHFFVGEHSANGLVGQAKCVRNEKREKGTLVE
jgi:hypothetical protein